MAGGHGMNKGTMIDAEYWRKLWDVFGDQCGGIRTLGFGAGLMLVFDPPITRGSYAVPEDFPHARSDGGSVYVFGVVPTVPVRPGASGEASGVFQASVPADGDRVEPIVKGFGRPLTVDDFYSPEFLGRPIPEPLNTDTTVPRSRRDVE